MSQVGDSEETVATSSILLYKNIVISMIKSGSIAYEVEQRLRVTEDRNNSTCSE
jgi:hypothetical protein